MADDSSIMGGGSSGSASSSVASGSIGLVGGQDPASVTAFSGSANSTKKDDGSQSKTEPSLTIPDDVLKKFAELVELIKGSKSMDNDERQYWIDVLPIMSGAQLENLKGILDNEKKQLAEAAKVYSQGVDQAAKKAGKAFDEAAYLEKKKVREEAERQHEAEEAAHEEDVLAQLSAL